MTNVHPPRLAMWLLDRFAPDDEGLTGDLVEELERGRSRAWFWRQAIAAVALRRRPREIRPLHLVDEPAPVHRSSPAHRTVNLTASPIYGIGGLGLVALAVLITIMSPQSWIIALAILLNGALLGAILGYLRRRRSSPDATRPSLLDRS
jgi:hypothetical protein